MPSFSAVFSGPDNVGILPRPRGAACERTCRSTGFVFYQGCGRGFSVRLNSASSAGDGSWLGGGTFTGSRKACLPGINSAGRAIARACGGPTAAGVPAGAAAAADLPRVARWVVEQQRPGQSVVLEPQQQHSRQSEQQHRFSVCVGGRDVSEGGQIRRGVGGAYGFAVECQAAQPNRCPRAPVTGKRRGAGRGQ